MDSLPTPRLAERRQALKAFAWTLAGCILVLGAPPLLRLTFSTDPVPKPLAAREVAVSGASLPQWVPLYPKAEAKDPIWRLKEAKVQGSVVLYTHAPPERVIDFYAAHLPALGFAVDSRPEKAQVRRLLARASDGRQLTVQSGTGSDFTWIELDFGIQR